MLVPNIEIIVGTYEEFLLGYKFEIKDEKPILAQSFADKSHSGSLKCLAVKAPWIATGSTDDRIFVYDMRTRKQTEIILSHEGTINALTFTPDNSYLFSGGDDGRMIATHVGNWVTNAAWKKAHDGKSVTHITCHPSGKLALTLGSDLILRTWNLVKGRVAYKTNLKSRSSLGHVADCIAWSPTGDYFSLSGQRIIEIWSIQKADVVKSQKTSSKPISVCWISDEECLAGLEDGNIIWFSLNANEKEVLIGAHDARVKAMAMHEHFLVTASSTGEIKVWQIDVTEKKLIKISATNIGCRPTCLGILELEQFGGNLSLEENNKEANPQVKKVEKVLPQRGVVEIEYENESDNEVDLGNKISDKINSKESDDENEVSNDSCEESSDEEQEEASKSKKARFANAGKNAKKSKLKKSNIKSQIIKDNGKKKYKGTGVK